MSRRTAGFVVGGLAVALLLAFGVSRYASTAPDGLEKVAADEALDTGATPHPGAGGPLADYSARGVDDPGLATGLAGVVGVLLTFVVTGALVGLASVRSGRGVAPADAPTPP